MSQWWEHSSPPMWWMRVLTTQCMLSAKAKPWISHEAQKKYLTSAKIKFTTSGFDHPLLWPLGWFCCWFLSLLRGFFAWFSDFPPFTNTNPSKSQFDLQCKDHAHLNRVSQRRAFRWSTGKQITFFFVVVVFCFVLFLFFFCTRGNRIVFCVLLFFPLKHA